jgi:diaminopimelate epimerase
LSHAVQVTGMSGAGNDFLVVGPGELEKCGKDRALWARRVCTRGLSLGCDGVLFIDVRGPDRIGVTFVNPDGSSAFCGNGSRCAARYAHLEGLAARQMQLDTDAGLIPAEVCGASVRLELPAPTDHGERVVECDGRTHRGRFLTAGIPHFVLFVEDPASAPLQVWGPELRRHRTFGASGTNVNVAAVEGARVRLRTWERGVERETLCCGSGAVAAAQAARLLGAPERLEILPASGVAVRVELPGDPETPEKAVLEGEARVLFRGQIDPEALEWTG